MNNGTFSQLSLCHPHCVYCLMLMATLRVLRHAEYIMYASQIRNNVWFITEKWNASSSIQIIFISRLPLQRIIKLCYFAGVRLWILRDVFVWYVSVWLLLMQLITPPPLLLRSSSSSSHWIFIFTTKKRILCTGNSWTNEHITYDQTKFNFCVYYYGITMRRIWLGVKCCTNRKTLLKSLATWVCLCIGLCKCVFDAPGDNYETDYYYNSSKIPLQII